MGIPTTEWTNIDATLDAVADQIVAFTNQIQNLQNVGAETIPVNISTNPVVSISGAGTTLTTSRPSYVGGEVNTAAFTGDGAPSILSSNIATLTVPAAPTAPAISFPTAPSSTLPLLPASPVLSPPSIPVKPNLSIPTVPELDSISLPALTIPQLPTYDQTFPAVPDDLLAPVPSFSYTEEDYVSEELTNLRALLNDDLVNGGWGVTHQDEEDLFSRERERLRDESLLQEEELFDSFAARGFNIPQGDQVDQIRVLQKQTLDKLQEVNLDISAQRADLIRKSRENVISQSNTLNQAMTTFRGFMQQRLLQAAEFLAGYGINLFNAKVERHNLLINAYNSFTSAYTARVNAVIQQVQITKTLIEAEAVKNEVNRTTIQLYQSQIEAATSVIQLYQSEVDAAKVLSDIERDKLEIFRTEIDAYKAQIDAEISKANLYSTQIGAEEIKSRVFATNVSAYETEVRANVSEQQARIEEANLRLREDGVRLERYRANIDLFRANIEKRVTEMDSFSRNYGTQASLYGSYASAYASYINSLITEENVEVQASIKEAEVESLNRRFNADAVNTQARLQSDAAAAAAKVYGDYAAAFSQINANLDIDVL